MSAITSAERFVFLDRLMSRPWLSQAVMSLDKLACFALDTIDASWDVIKEPVTEVVETAAFSSLGQFTISCLESGVNITANVLDVVLPVKATDDDLIDNEHQDHGHKAKKRPVLLSLDSRKKTKFRERKVTQLQPIRTVSTFTIHALRNLQKTLNSLKHDGDLDICGHCTKRRKVVALRRLGPLHSLAHLSFDAFASPMKLVGLNVSWDGLKCVFTSSGNDRLDKSPVRPKSATEKRRYTELSSSDDEEQIDDIHRFHDDLDDYQSDEDEDYEQPEICCQESDSDEYAAGETESDVSLDESPAPLKPREAKMAAKMAAKKGYEDIPEGFIRPSNKKSNKKSPEKQASKESKKSPTKGANKLGGKDGKTTSDKENKETKTDANEKGAKDANPRKGSGSSVDTHGGNTGVVNGQKINKDLTKITNEGKKGSEIKAPLSPLRKLIGV